MQGAFSLPECFGMEDKMHSASRRLTTRRRDYLGGLKRLIVRLAVIRATLKGRRALARMDARMLSDIGITPTQAEFEINRRPWDVT
jgi:uncharacterized protein YjiS (DUF1127 family)